MTITFSFVLPTYLKQWLIHTMGGDIPVRFPKGSAFSSFLRVFLRHKREREVWTPPGPDAVEIVVPKFPGKDPMYHNYLPLKAQVALGELIRDAFDVQLFREMSAFGNATRKREGSKILTVWMEENGIEVTDTNWCAVAKRLQILRTRASDRERKKLAYKRRRNNGNYRQSPESL